MISENNEKMLIFEEEKPNSVRTNRPLLEALCEENHQSSTCVCLSQIEYERNFMKNKIIQGQTFTKTS